MDLKDDEEQSLVENWMGKQSSVGSEQKQLEFDLWKQWRADPTPATFEELYGLHRPLLEDVNKRLFRTSNLPPSTLRSQSMKLYADALSSYDPDRGAGLSTHIGINQRHLTRYNNKYTNVARIPKEQADVIGRLNLAEQNLQEKLSRPPSSAEIADYMQASYQDIKKLRNLSSKDVDRIRGMQYDDHLFETPATMAEASDDQREREVVSALYHELSPEQQLIMEHSYDLWGRETILDNDKLGGVIGMSPQKIRALKKQIAQKVNRYL